MATFLVDGVTPVPDNGASGWGTVLNTAILAVDARFTYAGGYYSLASSVTGSSLTSVGTLTSIAVSGAASFGSTIAVTGAGTITGDLAVNGGDITTTAATATVFNATATTLNIGQAATTVSVGALTGTTTVRNGLTVTGTFTATVNGGTP